LTAGRKFLGLLMDHLVAKVESRNFLKIRTGRIYLSPSYLIDLSVVHPL
jgi:hypothetical protein